MTKLKLIKTENFEGYEMKNLSKWMKEQGRGKEWGNWYCGSTGAIHEGKFIVYKWDVDSFLAGKPNLD